MFTPAAAVCVVPKVGIMGVALENTVCLRADLLLLEPYASQVIAVAEELTHVLLNVADENLAAWIVTFLCSDLATLNQKGFLCHGRRERRIGMKSIGTRNSILNPTNLSCMVALIHPKI